MKRLKDPIKVGKAMDKDCVDLSFCFSARDRFYAQTGNEPEHSTLSDILNFSANCGDTGKYEIALAAFWHGILEEHHDPRDKRGMWKEKVTCCG